MEKPSTDTIGFKRILGIKVTLDKSIPDLKLVSVKKYRGNVSRCTIKTWQICDTRTLLQNIVLDLLNQNVVMADIKSIPVTRKIAHRFFPLIILLQT